jgi:hypothetical protein
MGSKIAEMRELQRVSRRARETNLEEKAKHELPVEQHTIAAVASPVPPKGHHVPPNSSSIPTHYSYESYKSGRVIIEPGGTPNATDK